MPRIGSVIRSLEEEKLQAFHYRASSRTGRSPTPKKSPGVVGDVQYHLLSGQHSSTKGNGGAAAAAGGGASERNSPQEVLSTCWMEEKLYEARQRLLERNTFNELQSVSMRGTGTKHPTEGENQDEYVKYWDDIMEYVGNSSTSDTKKASVGKDIRKYARELLHGIASAYGPHLSSQGIKSLAGYMLRVLMPKSSGSHMDGQNGDKQGPSSRNLGSARQEIAMQFHLGVSADAWQSHIEPPLTSLLRNLRHATLPSMPGQRGNNTAKKLFLIPSVVPDEASTRFQLPDVLDGLRSMTSSEPQGHNKEWAQTGTDRQHESLGEYSDASLLWSCVQHTSSSQGLPAENLAAQIINLVKDYKQDEVSLQGALFDLLGEDSIAFMQEILSNRDRIVHFDANSLKELQDAMVADGNDKNDGQTANLRPVYRPQPGGSVTVQTSKDKALIKRRKKLARKYGVSEDYLYEAGFDPEYLEQERALGLQNGTLRSGATAADFGLPMASTSDFEEQGLTMLDSSGHKKALPANAEVVQHEKWKEVHVPATLRDPSKENIPLIQIENLDEYSKMVFSDIVQLNHLQSAVFNTGYRSNENMLVCAPTGAGKTNVALLTILRTIAQHSVAGIIQRNTFKIVYVAPMKALAQEIVAKVQSRLSCLGITVRELTGDMQLTRAEISATQIIVTTPEKWDVITRKAGEGSVVELVKLLIIDEVHLLADSRGAVIESIVARTLRLMEMSQKAVRIVGLSATLPNYKDVSLFLRVNPEHGLFHFGNAYRPVPLEQQFVGITEHNSLKKLNYMNLIAYTKAIEAVKQGKQAMVFVHSRKDTANTAKELIDLARNRHELPLLSPFLQQNGLGGDDNGEENDVDVSKFTSNDLKGKFRALGHKVEKSRNKDVRELFQYGLGMHHAGMLRSDRSLEEQLFSAGAVKILVCTATLAWGVNLPAHTVIIKGTQVYNSEAGGFTDLGLLDVMQIFGRAGRPQFDTQGRGIIITTHDKLSHYLSLLTHRMPIESRLIKAIPDHLNAEIVGGSVVNVREAIVWLSYTFLFVRMLRNPRAYGINFDEFRKDPMLEGKRAELINEAAKRLDECRMIRYNVESGNVAATDLGRVASHFYITHESVEIFNERLGKDHKSGMGAGNDVGPLNEQHVVDLVCHAAEFRPLKVRDEELGELDKLKPVCRIPVKGDPADIPTKVNVLLQSYISRIPLKSFTLISDTSYINQSAGRIARGLFEIALRKGWCTLASQLLSLCKSVDKRCWWMDSPLRQFELLNPDILYKLESRGTAATLDSLRDMQSSEIGAMLRHPAAGPKVSKLVRQVPKLDVDVKVQPVTRGILRVTLTIAPDFQWNDKIHGNVEPWYIWVEDTNSEQIFHYEYFLLSKKQAKSEEVQTLTFSIPIFEPIPPQYWVRILNDRWVGVEDLVEMPFRKLILPDRHPPHTDLLDLQPLPVTALQNEQFEKLYSYTHFNPIQTQVFHVAYHTDHNMLLGAPTGSGKTVGAELAVLRLLSCYPKQKAVYVGPLKALTSERLKDWRRKFTDLLGYKIVELTGDHAPDLKSLKEANIVVTTPEKWDSISRSWQKRPYVKKVGLVIMDEIHMLGEERGPVLEVIVSRMRYISSHLGNQIRLVGLSTALANATDLADWLGIERVGLYNFRPFVRPVPMDVHIQGFPGKHYCPRMAAMNKPTYTAITTYSPTKPTLIFVSSRRQTRLTALELISLCAADENPKKFLHMAEADADALAARMKDGALQHTLGFGIGIHHAGLKEQDRATVEELFESGKIQILVCTSTLAWGVNLPAHLVVVKGTEYFDGKQGRYVDFPVTDVLQMMGRAGRPQYDNHGVACIMVQEQKKNFYRKFLYEPFPVESSLHLNLHDHINAEIAASTITTMQDAVDYISWTYFFRRLLQNPTYYGLENQSKTSIQEFLKRLVVNVFNDLNAAGCVVPAEEEKDQSHVGFSDANLEEEVEPTVWGLIGSTYYLSYKTVAWFGTQLEKLSLPSNFYSAMAQLVYLMCQATEFDELPVRHNEEYLNAELAEVAPWKDYCKIHPNNFDDPHVKAYLLVQSHMAHIPLPISDYINDTKSVLDQTARILPAMIDIAADIGVLSNTLTLMEFNQCLVQGRMPSDSTVLQLPGCNMGLVKALNGMLHGFCGETLQSCEVSEIKSEEFLGISLGELIHTGHGNLQSALSRSEISKERQERIISFCKSLPRLDVAVRHKDSVLPSTEIDVHVDIRLENKQSFKDRVRADRFPKQKQFGWWLVIGDTENNELLALKRITLSTCEHSLVVMSPEEHGEYEYQLYLMCDSMAGLDQQYTVSFSVADSPASS
eukprot:gb/GECG01005814.1/.p1 GENE.gb/GECG01005814.1/~~gb/GECG01005814.1/.p1  ORF type:complete len:2316 (+),score=249.07 gb/GECG01005814.1/:1-6948(+)